MMGSYQTTYATNYGVFVIPDDVPVAFRKDGWFDRRRKITPTLKQYFDDMECRLRDGMRVLSWAEWHN